MIFELTMFELIVFELTIFLLDDLLSDDLWALELAYNTESAAQLPYSAYLIDIIGRMYVICARGNVFLSRLLGPSGHALKRALKILPTLV